MTAALFFYVRARKYLVRNHQSGILAKSNERLSNLHQIFIKPSSNLLALTFVLVYIENVKEKNQIPLYIKIKVPPMKSPLNLLKSLLAVAGAAALSAVSAAPASAFNFSNITGGDTVGDAYASNYNLEVVDQGERVLFNIYHLVNPATASSFIRQVYFDDNNYLSDPWPNIGNFGTVAFSGGAGNNQLPQGGNNFTTDYYFSRDVPGNGNAIQPSEKLGVSFQGNYANVVTALNSGALRLGIHVQGLPGGASDSYITSNSGNTQDTPEPLTMLAAGAAVGFGTMFKKQRDRAQKAE
ncbi:PEP-CTERM sorting domain-containing protein [Microcoleus sp. herbarium2]|uniref:PEP-CTERM sorting domain-containing protein n=1 Tax=Microcoleus sp. herbarium2 TaxID=3055433 RepID=UPI002FD3C63B